MSTNPLKGFGEGDSKRGCPPNMPRGDSPADKEARQRFWIEYGNAHLAEIGKPHLQWKAKDGNYWIEAQ